MRALFSAWKRLKRRFKRWLGLFDPLRILAFRGHGTPTRLFVAGRLIEREAVAQGGGNLLANVRAAIARLRSDEIPGARLALRHGEVRAEVVTDDEGYFRAELEPAAPVAPGWHEVHITLLESMAGSEGITAKAEVLVPDPDARLAVVSDIDDTVIKTGAASRLRLALTVLFNDARSREPFEGAAAFYRALLGDDGAIFYVSRTGWNDYDLLDVCLAHHGFPRGPMFLTDLSLVEAKSAALGRGEDKLTRILGLLDAYPELPFVLVGDSGQKDPEIYRRVVAERPGRVRAVYIRDVTTRRRDAEVRALLGEMSRAGVPAAAVEDTREAARHAARLGLVAAPGSLV
jgi:phosphatidate phosphatase APP1